MHGVSPRLRRAQESAPPTTRSDHPLPRGNLQVTYLMCTPEMARAMISRWISLVPSKMV